MEAREFMKLAAELNLEDTPDGGTGLQGSAKDISQFLEAGDPTVDHMFLGVYGAMLAANLDRVCITLNGENGIDDTVMNGTQLRLHITEESLVVERLHITDEHVDPDLERVKQESMRIGRAFRSRPTYVNPKEQNDD